MTSSADIPRFVSYLEDLSGKNRVYGSPYIYYSPNIRFLGLERKLSLDLIEDVSAFTAAASETRDRVFVCDGPELNLLVEELYPGAERLGTYAMYENRSGRIYRVGAEALHRSLDERQLEAATFLIGMSQQRFRARTGDW